MERYFFEIAYDGSDFSGWQNQENARTVQGFIESKLSQLYNQSVSIIGCGRTDAGVHASQYYFHADLIQDLFVTDELRFKLNNMLGAEIAVKNVIPVKAESHARFDATNRSYKYYIGLTKDPFNREFRYQVPQSDKLDILDLNSAASMLLNYQSFFPFCKSNSDVNNYNCQLTRSEWINDEDDLLVFNISSNRFLRGMVRLIVGMCLNVSKGKLKLSEVENALIRQERLPLAWSAPGHALFLDRISYPYIK